MKFLNSILYLLAVSVISTTATTPEDDDRINLSTRDAEEMPLIYARREIARNLEQIDLMERRAEGLWKRAFAAKKALKTHPVPHPRTYCSYNNCNGRDGRPDDSDCIDKGCRSCGGTPGHYRCEGYDDPFH